MTKYINADKVIDYANQEITAAFYYPQDTQERRKQDEQAYKEKWVFVKHIMVNMPVADVEETRHGKWIDQYGDGDWHCSRCGAIVEKDEQRRHNWYRCYHCGAKMDGVTE